MKSLPLFLLLSIFFNQEIICQSQKANIVPLPIGTELPDFSLIGIDDKMYTPEDFKEAKVLVIIFTCNHCPTAQAYEQRILELYRSFSKKGVDFIAISPNNNDALSLAECGYTDLDDSFEAMKIRAKDLGLEFPYLYDGDSGETSMKFGPLATPHVFIFDEVRKLRYRGRIDDMESPYEQANSFDTKNAITALLNGEEVPVETTKTFGCSVKWPWKDEWTKQLKLNWAEEAVSLHHSSKDTLIEIMSNKSDKLRLLNVWATYCGPCVMEFPDLVDTYRMYGNRGFEFVSLSMDRPKNEQSVLQFLEKNEASVRNYIWTGGTSYQAIDLLDPSWQGSLPYTILIKPGGEIVYKAEGPVNILELRKTIINELGRYFADD